MEAEATPRDPTSKTERILDAALGLFAERGFYGTAVPLVAKTAGVGAGTIYRYFKSKEHLVNELFRREKRCITEHVLGRFPFSESPRNQFHFFFERIVEYAKEHPESFRFLEHHHHAAYLDEESIKLEVEVTEYALNYVRVLKMQGIARDVEDHVFLVVVWGTIVRVMREVWTGSLELTPSFVENLEQACWEAIRA